LTRWGYITLHLLWLCGRWNEIKLFAAHMADIITDGHKQIWMQYRAFFENEELELEAHLALEWGLKFFNPEMAWTAEGDAEFNLPPGFKAHRMPLHIVQLKSKLAKMSAPAGASESSANLMKTVFPNSFTRLAELDLQPAALEVQQKLLVSKAEAFISAAIDTLKNNGEDRWMSQDFMWGCLTELCLQAYFARWLYAKVLIVETDSFNFTAVLLPGVEVLEKMQSVYWTDGLAAQMRGQWQRWLAAGDLGYAPYARFVSDLQKMGEGTYVNIALEDNAFRELYRLVWFSININAVILEATFNQLDNQMVKKTPMGPEVLQGRVLYTANVLSAHHATRRSEHVPKELNAPRGKVAARVPGAVRGRTRERIVQTHASMVRASELVKKRSYDVYRGAPRVDASERLIKSTKATYAAKYDKDCVAQTQRAAARAPIDWAERARQQGGLEKKGSSCTGVNLAQISIEPIREMVATFGLDGMETAAKIKAQMKKPGKAVVGGEATAAVKALLAAPRLKEILEEQLKKLFDDNDMQTFGAHKRTLQLLREKNNSKGSDATASEQTARKKARNSASPAVA
jgi:hypothetical protein